MSRCGTSVCGSLQSGYTASLVSARLVDVNGCCHLSVIATGQAEASDMVRNFWQSCSPQFDSVYFVASLSSNN